MKVLIDFAKTVVLFEFVVFVTAYAWSAGRVLADRLHGNGGGKVKCRLTWGSSADGVGKAYDSERWIP